jgi:hypothetical protein
MLREPGYTGTSTSQLAAGCQEAGEVSLQQQRIDRATIVGWGALLLPLLTMWHEIGGHAATCAMLGGRTAEIGAFYVACRALSAVPDALVACSGVIVNALLAVVAYLLWRRASADSIRLPLWLVWVSEAFIATGYLCFSGVTGAGDLGTGPQGSLSSLPAPMIWRTAELALGVVSYMWVARAGIAGLNLMLGTGSSTRPIRQRIAHTYYVTCGIVAVLVGILNPLGLFVTIMSAAASSFGGLAGFISIGFAARGPDQPRTFIVDRDARIIVAGLIASSLFAAVLGPTIRL